MVFDWKVEREYLTDIPAQDLFETTLAHLNNSELELKASEAMPDSFRISTALKSKMAYVLSYDGNKTNYGSTRAEISYTGGIVTIAAWEPISASLHSLLFTFMTIVLDIVLIRFSQSVDVRIGLLLAVLCSAIMLIPYYAFSRARVKKCFKAALRCALGSIQQNEIT